MGGIVGGMDGMGGMVNLANMVVMELESNSQHQKPLK